MLNDKKNVEKTYLDYLYYYEYIIDYTFLRIYGF